jgi:hypothetical protein
VVGPADVLVAQEQHLVLEQQRTDLVEEAVVARGMCQVHADELGSDAGGQWFYSHVQSSVARVGGKAASGGCRAVRWLQVVSCSDLNREAES